MSELPYKNQTITQYLLGALPEAETERLDELSVTDGQFAGALSAVEKDLVDAYVHGELKGRELERFNSYYLASPVRRERVKFAQGFRVFTEPNAVIRFGQGQEENPAESATEQRRGGWFSALSAFFAPRFALPWGLTVAALALLIAGSWLAFENVRLRQQMSQTQTARDVLFQREQDLRKELEGQRSTSAQAEHELARVRNERERLEQELKTAQKGGTRTSASGEGSIVSLILAPPLRGVGQTPTVSIPPETNLVATQLQLEVADHSAYRVVLIEPAKNQTLWRSGRLTPRTIGERKVVAVSFPAGLLKPQHYILRVAGIQRAGKSEIVGDYPFRVVK